LEECKGGFMMLRDLAELGCDLEIQNRARPAKLRRLALERFPELGAKPPVLQKGRRYLVMIRRRNRRCVEQALEAAVPGEKRSPEGEGLPPRIKRCEIWGRARWL